MFDRETHSSASGGFRRCRRSRMVDDDDAEKDRFL
jgi:hypothetical protein